MYFTHLNENVWGMFGRWLGVNKKKTTLFTDTEHWLNLSEILFNVKLTLISSMSPSREKLRTLDTLRFSGFCPPPLVSAQEFRFFAPMIDDSWNFILHSVIHGSNMSEKVRGNPRLKNRKNENRFLLLMMEIYFFFLAFFHGESGLRSASEVKWRVTRLH